MLYCTFCLESLYYSLEAELRRYITPLFENNPTTNRSRSQFAALSKEQQLIDVFSKADQKLLKKAVEKFKGFSRSLNKVLHNKGENMPPGLASQVLEANNTAGEILDHFDQIGLSAELDQMVPALVRSSPSYVMPMNFFSDSSLRKQFHDQAMDFLKGTGISRGKLGAISMRCRVS